MNLKQTMADCVTALKQWTGKAHAMVIFDSTVDEFTNDGLFVKVKGKPNIAVVGFTTDGDVFGGFYSVAVTKQDKGFYDPNMFIFSFESHGRCETPQRFVLKEGLRQSAGVWFVNGDCFAHLYFGVKSEGDDCGFSLCNERSNSFCWNMSWAFEGLKGKTLTGKNGSWFNGPHHHCTRLVAVQLE